MGGAGGLASIGQPFANHNGGNSALVPMGISTSGWATGFGQRSGSPRPERIGAARKMLRIDVNVPDSHSTGYQIPADNPFVAGHGPVAARPEIWAFGLRNPWRYSFDDPIRGGTGALVIGDVGQSSFEEIDYEPSHRGGRNYGWRNREGAHDNVTTLPPAFLPLTDPVFEYGRSAGQSITGGFVYRGRALGPSFSGRYFFADFVAGRVWSIALVIDPSTGNATASNLIEHTSELGNVGNVSSFGIDADGELYVVSYSNGSVLKVMGPPIAPLPPTGLRIIR
jgi:glucose/arabinose dehydrogenase